MRHVRTQIIPIRSAFPATRRNSPPQTLSLREGSAHESPAPANLSPSRFRRVSERWNLSSPRDRLFQKRDAFPWCARSFDRTALRSPIVCEARDFLFPKRGTSANSPRAAATRRAQTLSPNNPPRPTAAPAPRFSRYPAQKPSAQAIRFLLAASILERRFHPRPASLHRVSADPAGRAAKLPAQLPPIPLRLRDISLPR